MTQYQNTITLTEQVEVMIYDMLGQSFLTMREQLGDLTDPKTGLTWKIMRDLNGTGFYVEREQKTPDDKWLTAHININDLLKNMVGLLETHQMKEKV